MKSHVSALLAEFERGLADFLVFPQQRDALARLVVMGADLELQWPVALDLVLDIALGHVDRALGAELHGHRLLGRDFLVLVEWHRGLLKAVRVSPCAGPSSPWPRGSSRPSERCSARASHAPADWRRLAARPESVRWRQPRTSARPSWGRPGCRAGRRYRV